MQRPSDRGSRPRSLGVAAAAVALTGAVALIGGATGPNQLLESARAAHVLSGPAGHASAARHASGPHAEADLQLRLHLPLVGRNQDYGALPDPPTLAPPSVTPTPEWSPTPTETATPAPPACASLAERVRVSAIDVHPDRVKVKQGRWDPTSPVFLAPRQDADGSIVAWADRDGSVHLTRMDEVELRDGDDITLPGDEVRGLVAHGEGPALLVVRGDELHFVRLDAAGAVAADVRLVGGVSQTVTGSKWVDDWGHEARLVWAEERYGVYSGHTQQFGSRGKHQGDLLWFLDRDGDRIDAADDWDWGCSHSLDLRLAHNGTRFGPVCLSDAYPSEGFHFNHTFLVRPEPSGDGAGYSAANLGGWVPFEDGFLMTFSSPEGRASSDVGLLRVRNSGAVGGVRWLTATDGADESAPHLAAYGDRLLAGWTSGSDHLIAAIDAQGQILEGPVAIDALAGARDDFVTFPDGDVAWAYAWDDMSELKVVRVDWCDESAPTATPTEQPTQAPPSATTPGPGTTPSSTATTGGTPGSETPRPSRTPRHTNTPPGGTPAPAECVDLIANGGFEDGLGGWEFDGEVNLRPSDVGGGRWAASFMGVNGATARLAQQVTMPDDTVAAYVVFDWRMTSYEAETATRRFDWLDVGVASGPGTPRNLESIGNLSGRDAWRPSGHALALGNSLHLVFDGTSNMRDPTRIDVDDVRLYACRGSAPSWPPLSVSPPSGPADGAFVGSGSGFLAGEKVVHWALEPETLQRYDLGSVTSGADGGVSAAVLPSGVAGPWRWGAIGSSSRLPGSASFTVLAP